MERVIDNAHGDTNAIDTPAHVQRLVWQRLAALTPSERAAMVDAMNHDAFALAEADVRHRDPGASEHEVRMRVIALRVGPELTAAAYGWTAPLDGT